MKKILAFVTVSLLIIPMFSVLLRTSEARMFDISIDGSFSDWTGVPSIVVDPKESPDGTWDIAECYMANNEQYLFIRIDRYASGGEKTSLAMRTYLDTDRNPSTGYSINGIGGDYMLVFSYGDPGDNQLWKCSSGNPYSASVAKGPFAFGSAGNRYGYETRLSWAWIGNPNSADVIFLVQNSGDYAPDSGHRTYTRAGDFMIDLNPDSGQVSPGGSTTSTVTVTQVGGYSSSTSLSASGQPNGVTVSFSTQSGTPTFTSTITIQVGSSVPANTEYPITITATGTDTTTHSETYTLTVINLDGEITDHVVLTPNVRQGGQLKVQVTVKNTGNARAEYNVYTGNIWDSEGDSAGNAYSESHQIIQLDPTYSKILTLPWTTPSTIAIGSYTGDLWLQTAELGGGSAKQKSYLGDIMFSVFRAGDITVTGIFKYDADHPMRRVTVALYDYDPRDLSRGIHRLAEGMTDDNGRFNFVVSNEDPLDGSGLDLLVRAYSENPAAYCDGYYHETAKEPRYEDLTVSSVDFGEVRVPTQNIEAWEAIDACLSAYKWFGRETGEYMPYRAEVTWPNEDPNEDVQVRYWPHCHWRIKIDLPEKNYYRWSARTVYHEYGHLLMFWAYAEETNLPPVTIKDTIPHDVYNETDGGFALREGWAEFIQGIIENDVFDPEVLRATLGETPPSGNIETNQWYNYLTSGRMDGNIVEGSVASVFWDIYDKPEGDDDGLSLGLAQIWSIVKSDYPQDIIDFWRHWFSIDDNTQTNYNNEEQMTNVFRKYGIQPPASLATLIVDPNGGRIYVDGIPITVSTAFEWAIDSSHTLDPDSGYSPSSETRLIFAGWSDWNNADPRYVTVLLEGATYTARWNRQYYVTFQQSGCAGAPHVVIDGDSRVLPYSDWVDEGSSYSFAFESTVVEGEKRWVLTSSSHSSPITIGEPTTITGYYSPQQKTTYFVDSKVEHTIDADGDGYFDNLDLCWVADAGLLETEARVEVYIRRNRESEKVWLGDIYYTIRGSERTWQSYAIAFWTTGRYDFELQLYGTSDNLLDTLEFGADPDITNIPLDGDQPIPFERIDFDGNGKINIIDISLVCKAYGERVDDPNWKGNHPLSLFDLDMNGIINIVDLAIVASHFGQQIVPELEVYPTTLEFGEIEQGRTAREHFHIRNDGVGNLEWEITIEVGSPWLSVNQTSGSGEAAIEAIVNTADVQPASYHGELLVTSNGGEEYIDVFFACGILRMRLTDDSSTEDRPSMISVTTPEFEGYFLAYQSWGTGQDNHGDIFIKKFDRDWILLQTMQVTNLQSYQDSPSLALVFDGNSYSLMVAYISSETGSECVFIQSLDLNLNFLSPRKQITSSSYEADFPSIVFNDQDRSVYISYQTWERGEYYNGDIAVEKLSTSLESKKKVMVTTEISYEDSPSLLYISSAGKLYVTYVSDEKGNLDIMLKQYDMNLNYLNFKLQLTTDPSAQNRSTLTAIREDYGSGYEGFVVAYQSWENGLSNDGDIIVKQFDTSWTEVQTIQTTSDQYYEDSPTIVPAYDSQSLGYIAYVSNEAGNWDIWLQELK